MNSTDRIFYIMGLVLLGGLVMVEILAAAGVLTLTDLGFSCSFLSVTGLYCPGCGGTHAVCALAGGHLWESFRYHPFVPYTGLLFLVFVVWNSLCTVVNKKNRRQEASFFSLPYRLGLYRSGHSSDPVDRKKCPSLCLVYIR